MPLVCFAPVDVHEDAVESARQRDGDEGHDVEVVVRWG